MPARKKKSRRGPLPKRPSKFQLERLYRKKTSAEIALLYGCTGQTVLNWLRAHKLHVRARHERPSCRGRSRSKPVRRERWVVVPRSKIPQFKMFA